MSSIIQISNTVYLSYRFFHEFGIPKKTVEKWRKAGAMILKDGVQSYVSYPTIPLPTRKKLPSEQELRGRIKGEEQNKEVDAFYKKLQYAQLHNFNDHREYYRDTFGMDADLAFKTSMKRAVWDRIIELHQENQIGKLGGLKKGILSILFKSYDQLYTGQYSSDSAFSRAIKTVIRKGVDTLVVDSRLLGLRKPNLKYDDRHLFFLRGLISTGKAYKAPKIREKMLPMCEEAGIPCPSVSWVKNQACELKKQFELHTSRYGADVTDKITPYAGIKPALFADDQYQVDGWDLPFYYLGEDRNGNPRLKKLILIAVKDAYSRKIVGFSIGRSENRLSLFEALQDTIGETGAMPFELVTDNHSYNVTKEVEFFASEAQKIGMTWTIDSNPKRKAIAERGFADIGERFCKDHYGYIGQGIKTRDKDGRSKQDLIDKYQKSGGILSEDEIRSIGCAVVFNFNKTPLAAKGKSPNQLYDESEKPHRFEIDLFERMRLFTKRTEYKVSRGQINIVIAGVKHEYQLNAELYGKYNSKTVAVRYADLGMIYLFDLKTDKALGSVKSKEMAHGALANQTVEDIEILNRHTGRLKGIKAQARKNNEDIARKASELNPGVFDILNRHTTPKDVMKMAEEDEEYRRVLQRQGIDLSRMTTVPKVSEIEIQAFKEPIKTQKQKSPMAVKSQMSVIDQER